MSSDESADPSSVRVFRNYLNRDRTKDESPAATSLPALESLGSDFGDLSLICGGTGAGKTTLAMQWAMSAACRDAETAVVFYSFEGTSVVDFFDRVSSMLAGVSLSDSRSAAFQKRVTTAQEFFLNQIAPRFSFFTGASVARDLALHRSFVSHFADIAKAYRERGFKNCITIVDRLQRMPVPAPAEDGDELDTRACQALQADPDHWRLEQLRWCCTNARHYGWIIPRFLVISQLRKGSGQRAELEDVLGGSGIVYDADSIFLLQPEPHHRKGPDITPTLLRVAKCRTGRTGEVLLHFRHQEHRFAEIELPGTPASAQEPEHAETPHVKPTRFAGT